MNADSVINALYDRLILRDVFSKTMPGITVVVATAVSITAPAEAIDFFRGLPVFAWIVLLCFSWIMGLAVQAIGENFKFKWVLPHPLILTFPLEIQWEEWIRLSAEFEQRCSKRESQRNERLRVIKETSGNFYVALVLSVVVWIMSILSYWALSNDMGSHWMVGFGHEVVTVLMVIVANIWGMRKMHLKHVRLQYLFVQKIVGREKKEDRETV